MLEILRSIAELNDKKLDDVVEVAKQKRLKRGGFEKKIYLSSPTMHGEEQVFVKEAFEVDNN